MVRLNRLSHTGFASDNPMFYISKLSEISQTGTQKTYWMLQSDTGNYYIFEPERAAVTEVVKNLSVKTRRGKLWKHLLSIGRKRSLTNYLIPRISKKSINIPESFSFNVGFIRHKANFLKKNDSVLVMGPKEALYRDIRASFMIPDSVNAPKILRSNVQEGYYIKDYEFGRNPDVNNFSAVFLAYDQLDQMYERNRKDTLSTEQVLSDLCEQVGSQSSFSKEELRSLVQSYEFPDNVNKSFIHGDLFFKNLLFREWADDVSIIDWSWSRNDFVFADVYLPLHMYCLQTEEKNVFSQMISKNGEFHDFHSQSVQRLGEQMYNDDKVYSGMPILYLLYSIANYSDSELIQLSEELLGNCINSN